MSQPNVLILMCDQMQARRMGFVDGIAHTPNLDALAAEGAHFSNAITVHGQCVPSRCAFVTGKSPHETHVMVNFGFHGHCGTLTPRTRTFFHEFQEAGYTTAHFGKSHLGAPLRTLGFDVGECLDGHFPDGKEPVERIRLREESLAKGGDGYAAQSEDKSCHYKALDEGLAWLKGYQPGEKPLLFMFDTNLPHPPFYWENEWRDRFKPEDMILPRSYYEETFDGKPPFLKAHAKAGPHKLESEVQLREEMAQYYTLIAAVDKACGQFIDVFKEKGMWDNTIVLFFADHGDMMGGHRLRRKGTMPYEEIYNIPCIMKLPAGMRRKRATIEEPVISTDLPGALLELAGIEPSAQFADSGVMAALRRHAPTGNEYVFFEHYAAWYGVHPFYAARAATHKYVRWYGQENFEELYDLEKDPDELRNVVADPAYQEPCRDLSSRAHAWWKETGGQSADFYETEAFKDNLIPV
ncbi:MAG: sulfatase-like hydrolase/transferase [Lentisphaeria bacterium]|nr:sulfatase-like hydrolase/transferase [Lentisphaeria bacterium]